MIAIANSDPEDSMQDEARSVYKNGKLQYKFSAYWYLGEEEVYRDPFSCAVYIITTKHPAS